MVEYFDGGIIVDETFATAVTGLFAAGECTLGLFGANRVFSAITEMLVHGADAGWNAAEYARGAKVPAPDAQRLAEKRRKAEQPIEGAQGPGLREEREDSLRAACPLVQSSLTRILHETSSRERWKCGRFGSGGRPEDSVLDAARSKKASCNMV